MNIKSNRSKLLFACGLFMPLLISSALAQTSPEEPSFFTVEVIVFKLRDNDYFNSETWNSESTKPSNNNRVDLDADPATQRNLLAAFNEEKRKNALLFKKAKDIDKTLSFTADAISKSKQYDLLAYKSWQQPGLSEANAISMRIKGGRQFEKKIIEPVTLTNTSLTTNTDTEKTVAELDGNITIILSRFLHVRTDLLLTQPAKWVPIQSSQRTAQLNSVLTESNAALAVDAIIEPQYQLQLTNDTQAEDTVLFGFNFKTSRRMRSGELHHLDHPMLGVLVKVSKAVL